jgi:hypothetical protein
MVSKKVRNGHPEQREGSLSMLDNRILRFAQNDTMSLFYFVADASTISEAKVRVKAVIR